MAETLHSQVSSLALNAKQPIFSCHTLAAAPSRYRSQLRTSDAIDQDLLFMDRQYGSLFCDWIRSPNNIPTISQHLHRQLFPQNPSHSPSTTDSAVVISWIMNEWCVRDCAHLLLRLFSEIGFQSSKAASLSALSVRLRFSNSSLDQLQILGTLIAEEPASTVASFAFFSHSSGAFPSSDNYSLPFRDRLLRFLNLSYRRHNWEPLYSKSLALAFNKISLRFGWCPLFFSVSKEFYF